MRDQLARDRTSLHVAVFIRWNLGIDTEAHPRRLEFGPGGDKERPAGGGAAVPCGTRRGPGGHGRDAACGYLGHPPRGCRCAARGARRLSGGSGAGGPLCRGVGRQRSARPRTVGPRTPALRLLRVTRLLRPTPHDACWPACRPWRGGQPAGPVGLPGRKRGAPKTPHACRRRRRRRRRRCHLAGPFRGGGPLGAARRPARPPPRALCHRGALGPARRAPGAAAAPRQQRGPRRRRLLPTEPIA
jgi:hypothetical protein